jgi:lipoprotein-releasing system permease protein
MWLLHGKSFAVNALSWLVGLRYLSARKGSRFVSLFSFASVAGMAISVLAMVLVMSIMNGFEGEVRHRILRAVPHAQISYPQGIANWQTLLKPLLNTRAVLAVAPQDRARVLLESDSRIHGGDLFGVDPALEKTVSHIDQSMIEGEWVALQPGEFGVVLGRSLARQLRVAVGDSVNIILPQVSVTPLGLFPRSRHFKVVGIFSVGAQLDATQLYVHLKDASVLLRRGNKVDALRLRFDDVMQAPERLETLRRLPLLSGFELKSWRDENSTLFNAIRMEKFMVGLMLSVIIVVAVFNLVSILTMAVADRRNDIAVLRTIGASRTTVLSIFIIYGMAMGVIGVGIGAILGSLLALRIDAITTRLENIVQSSSLDLQNVLIVHLPSQWYWWQACTIAAFALTLCLIAVFYPAWRASQIHPAEALRYE